MRYLLVLVLFLLTVESFAQINTGPTEQPNRRRTGSSVIDDSTKQVYGPTTTKYWLEHDIRNNLVKSYVVDTIITDFHKFQFIAQSENKGQNLGNIGTAYQSIYPEAPEVIGARLGFTLYDRYFPDPLEIPIYDSKSPFSRFGIIWGGDGRSITEADFTRNIDERSNFGFNYRGLFIDKQIDRARRGDRNVLGTYYNLFGNYRTRNNKYFVSGNFSRNNHEAAEYGGILIEEDSSLLTFFDENRQGNLSDAETRELRTNYHIYQEYRLNDQVQFFHSHDRYKQFNDFTNSSSGDTETDADFFGAIALDTLPVRDRSKLIYRQHEVGVKGDFGKTFYSFYYKGREVNHDYKFIDEEELDFRTFYVENYGGFALRFGNDSVSYIGVEGEYLSGGNYKLKAEIKNSWFHAEGSSSRYLPSYVQRAYLSRHNEWRNDFESTINTKVGGGLNLNYKGLEIEPSFSYNLITDYVYFRELDGLPDTVRNIQPVQTSGDISIIQGELKVSYTFFKHFVFRGQAVYTIVEGSSADAVRVPSLLLNAQLMYSNILVDGNLHLQVGVDFHQRSAYFANAYDPSTMQFYVQNNFEINSFPVMDIFLNVKINRGRAFLKWNNFYELIRGTGYFTTPYYPGQITILDLGFDWILFD